MTARTHTTKRLALAVGAVAVVWLAQQAGIDLTALGSGGTGASSPASSAARNAAVQRVEAAATSRESGFMVTLDATVIKKLSDDRDGSRHQRFLIELETGRTLLVAHNIDLAERVPVREGDEIRVRGQYEWNERGGVLHWTHRDPDRNQSRGWIEHAGKRVE